MRTMHHIGQLSGIVNASLGTVAVLDVERSLVSRYAHWQHLLLDGPVIDGPVMGRLRIRKTGG